MNLDPQRARRDARGRHPHHRDRERQIGEASRGRRRVRPGPYVVLAVRDTGAGMDAEDRRASSGAVPDRRPAQQRARAAASRSCTASCGRTAGWCGCRASRGRGPAVKVYLPRSSRRTSRRSSEPTRCAARRPCWWRRTRTACASCCARCWTDYGHAVLTARHGRDALMVAERYERPIDLLVTDVVMPEMGGRELAETPAWPGGRISRCSTSRATRTTRCVQRGMPGRRGQFPAEAVHVGRASCGGCGECWTRHRLRPRTCTRAR